MPLYPYPYNKVVDPQVLPNGYLRTEIQLQQESSTPDPVTGSPSSGWTTAFSAMAAVELIANVQIGQNDTFASQVTHKILLNWPGEFNVTQGNRVICVASGEVYEVQSAVNLRQRNRVMHIYCIQIDGEV